MFDYHKNWMEFWFLVLMAIGLVIALFMTSAFISYILVFASGIFGGRLIYERKGKIVLPYTIITAGFLIGYLLGMRYGERSIAAVSFIIGAVLSYQLYNKKILRDTRF